MDTSLLAARTVFRDRSRTLIWHQTAAQNGREAEVIGVPDARRGEQPVAFVAAAEGQTLDEKALHEFIRSKLADYKVPKQIIIRPALPKNATGKILKTELRKQAVSR